jgi:hypothetical protein
MHADKIFVLEQGKIIEWKAFDLLEEKDCITQCGDNKSEKENKFYFIKDHSIMFF